MEITTRPRTDRSRRLGVRLALLAAAMLLAVLLPASLGLSQHAVGDDAMGGHVARGALAFEREMRSTNQLRPGDVISFPRPGVPHGSLITRRIVTVKGDEVITRGDARSAADPWLLDAAAVRPTLTVFVVPLVGYPQLLVPGLTWTVLALLVTAAAVGCLTLSRRRATLERLASRPVDLRVEGTT